MLDGEIVRFWGKGSLVRWPTELLDGTTLPEDARVFLTRVGMPNGADWSARFDLNLDEMRRSVSDPSRLVIGYDTTFPFCLDLQRAGCVVLVEANKRERFVNSDVRKFAECLLLFQKCRLSGRSMDREEEIQRLIAETEGAMRGSDPSAFADSQCYWAVIVELMKEGAL